MPPHFARHLQQLGAAHGMLMVDVGCWHRYSGLPQDDEDLNPGVSLCRPWKSPHAS